MIVLVIIVSAEGNDVFATAPTHPARFLQVARGFALRSISLDILCLM